MSEAYFPVGPGLGPEENFLSLDDILMSQEKLPSRAEAALPRLAAVLGKGAGAGQGDCLPEVTPRDYSSRQSRWREACWECGPMLGGACRELYSPLAGERSGALPLPPT